MGRLTKKDKDHIGGYAPNGTYDIDWKSKAFEKLGQYEDIEKKLGIGLDIFAKAIVNGFYGIWKNKIVLVKNAELTTTRVLDIMGIIDPVKKSKFCFESNNRYWILEKYGRTWALKKEDLNCRDKKIY